MKVIHPAMPLLIVLVALAVTDAGMQAATETEGGVGERRVSVVGSVESRPELQSISGIRGWVIDGTEITADAVAEKAARHHGPFILQDMVAELFLQQAAEQQGIVVTDEDLEQTIQDLRNQLGLRSEESFQSFLRAQRATPEWFRDKARAYALMHKVLADEIYISDGEVEASYRRNQAMYRRNETVQFRAMRFVDESAAGKALSELRKGRSFQEVAEETAPTPDERAIAGDIQFYERGQPSLPPQFGEALFAAPLNQVAGPIEIMGSFYLIRIEKKTDPRQFTLDEVRDIIRDHLRQQKLEQLVWPRWIGQRLADAQIELRRVE